MGRCPFCVHGLVSTDTGDHDETRAVYAKPFIARDAVGPYNYAMPFAFRVISVYNVGRPRQIGRQSS